MKFPCDNCPNLKKCLEGSKTRSCVKWDSWFRVKWREIRKARPVEKHHKWTEDDENKMWQLWDDFYQPKEIAKIMGLNERQIRAHLEGKATLKRTCAGTVCLCSNEKCEWKQRIDGVLDYCPLNHCMKGEK